MATTTQTLDKVNGWNCYVHLPTSYSSTTKTYPTIIFFPGLGEVGTNAANVIKYGAGAYVAGGWNGNVTNPDGTVVEFIVISLQPPASYPQESTMNVCLAQLTAKYRIDKSNVVLTGLSEGGWCASTFVTGDPLGGSTYASQVKLLVTIEGVKPDDNQPFPQLFSNFANAGGRYLCFEQSQDGRSGDQAVATMNATKAGTGIYIITTFGNGGHGYWDFFYGSAAGAAPNTFNIGGTTQTIYQWIASLVTPQVTVPAPVINSVLTLTAVSGTQVNYQITATNNPTSYNATGLPVGLNINSATGLITGTSTVTGIFNVTLTATNSGGSGSALLVTTINIPPATLVKTYTTIVKVYSDGTSTIATTTN